MEDMLSILYNHIVQESENFTGKSRKIENIIQKKVKALNMDDAQQEDVKALMYDFLGIFQEIYFKLGFQYGVRFMVEIWPEHESEQE